MGWSSSQERTCLIQGPVMLEPMMSIEAVCPDEYAGEVMGDFNGRRGRIEGMEQIASGKRLQAIVPLAEMFGYANDLRSKSQGRATYSMEFLHYEEVPPNVANQIMDRMGGLYRFR